MAKTIHVIGAIIVRDGRILAAQRGPGRSLAGLWEFPGGKSEPGESPQAALARELREEMLIDAQIGDFVGRSEFTYDFGTVRLDCYYATIGTQEPQLTEHVAIRWLAPAELRSVEWTPADIPILEVLETGHA
ncbi:MAG: (deoxy)nucleoside triphosphate pyrophosphohydrolase [Actinomycetaceae bacterium]|nr:(deoxy)nucleoside triphosphate pyrophosphohydrolase [Actinomycetaceae bacterium]